MSTVSRDPELRYIAESSLFLVPEIAGKIRHLHIPGVLGRVASVSHPIANLVGAARLDERSADATIDGICAMYRQEGKAFGWLVGASDTPGDLARRLMERGLVKVTSLACMRTDPSEDAPAPAGVDVREVGPDEFETAAQTLAEGYPAPLEAARLFTTDLLAYRALAPRAFLAHLPGEPKPAGVGMMITVPERPVAVFVNSCTLSDRRRRGVYRALCAHRLRAAARAGLTSAIVQADVATSAPICAKIGFQPISSLDFYAWMPPDASAHASA